MPIISGGGLDRMLALNICKRVRSKDTDGRGIVADEKREREKKRNAIFQNVDLFWVDLGLGRGRSWLAI